MAFAAAQRHDVVGRERRLLLPLATSVASLALHALLIGSLVVVGSPRRHRLPDKQGAGASALLSSADPVTALILLPISDASNTLESQPELSSRGFEPEPQLIRITSPDTAPSHELDAAEPDPDSRTVEAAGDAAGRALMFGRYLGQITARIERAWERPRTPVGSTVDERFQCQVGIEQGPTGEVREVTLKYCNGDVRWQLSLARAIQAASPLPAPPDPAVFVNSLTMTFQADAYEPGSGEQGYE